MNRSQRLRTWVVAAAGATTAAVAAIADRDGPWSGLILLGLGVVAGELLELNPGNRPRLPLSHAVVLVLLRVGTIAQVAVVVGAGQVAAFAVRARPEGRRARTALLGQRLVAAAAALAAYHGVVDHVRFGDRRWSVLLALGLAGLAQLAVDEVARLVPARQLRVPLRGRSAELALVTSGMLMAVGYSGVDGRGGMGLWGPLLFSVPLLAAWYSFEQLDSIRTTYGQTIRALSVVPELGGFARAGHAERVADLAVTLASELDLGRQETEQLATAALLHDIGTVCLDDPEVLGRPHERPEVAEAGATLLRSTEYLSRAGDYVAAEPLPHRPRGAEALPVPDTTLLCGQILKVATDFDDLAAGRPEQTLVAIEALYSSPGYVYDPRVLAALERILRRRGLVGTRA